MIIILDTPKGGRREVASEKEARRRMYMEAIQDTTITGYPTDLIIDSGEKEEIHYQIKTTEVPTVVDKISVNGVARSEIVEVHERKQNQNLKPAEEYEPEIRKIKNKQGIIVDEMYYDDGKVRIFAVGKKVHSVLYNSNGVKCYSRKIHSDEDLELAIKNEEVKWLTSLNNHRLVQQGAAQIVYSVKFAQLKPQYVRNIHYRTKGNTIYKQEIINGEQYNLEERTKKHRLEDENNILLDPVRSRDERRKRYLNGNEEIEGELEKAS